MKSFNCSHKSNRKLTSVFVIISFLLLPFLIISCFEFLSINQPSSRYVNQTFYTAIRFRYTNSQALGSNSVLIGVQLPIGWTIVNNQFTFSGDRTATITYNSTISQTLSNDSIPKPGYYWWVGISNPVNIELNDVMNCSIPIRIDNQTGNFSLDYIIGSSDGELFGLTQRNNNYPISVTTPLYGVPLFPDWVKYSFIFIIASLGIWFIWRKFY